MTTSVKFIIYLENLIKIHSLCGRDQARRVAADEASEHEFLVNGLTTVAFVINQDTTCGGEVPPMEAA